MHWPFRQPARDAGRLVRISEVHRCKPSQLRARLAGHAAAAVWTAGNFTDIGLTGARDLEVPIQRRFRSVPALCKAALKTASARDPLVLLMSEQLFHAHSGDQRLRAVVDHEHCLVLVVCGWLQPST
ncbi:hypothetical protein [Amycolatopsis albispora]|uniref:Uncharacterized protein n=1 Tax=Amycolatopsis albispora TaxID=1804986 RepID=A0A344L144_9PSEU|nr:hypothetical protein [Amycolatopsis albispora]AXB41768.1 hypothetical protein A4R43_03880 [Amycolatopsis albispora]